MTQDKPNKVGPPFKPPMLVKVPVAFKLPRWLLAWMRKYSEQEGISMAAMIEEALTEKHGVEPPAIKPKK